MDTQPVCPDCQQPLPEQAPHGICPECLLRRGLGSEVEIGTSTESPDRKSLAATGEPPFTVEELARFFPQLEVLAFVGRGGMGAVYQARQKQLGRVVALKVLPPEVSEDPAFAERFAREARALAQLNHPHIVTIHDFGETDGLFYLLMEFVDGVNLRHCSNPVAYRLGRRWPSCRRFAMRCSTLTIKALSTGISSQKTCCSIAWAG